MVYQKSRSILTSQAIGEMVDQWASGKKKNAKGNIECPSCGQQAFSFNKREKYRYDCHKCHDGPSILKSLIEMFGEEYKPEPIKKATRHKQQREWPYPDRQGNKMIKVSRTDDGNGKRSFNQYHWNGKQWVMGYGPVNREDIPIYRYQEIREAIALSQTIFITEGEPCADLLWKMGIPATCNIGGSGKWLPHHSKDLEGAKVVICPDRDVCGVEHADTIVKDFPDAQWLYAFPDSLMWQNLPENKGLDLADWVEDYKLSFDDIKAAVGPKRETAAHNQTGSSVGGKGNQGKNNVINHPRYNPDPIDHDELMDRIDQLIGDNLGETTVSIELTNLAKEFGIFGKNLEKIYSDRLKQLEQIEDREDTKQQLDYLLKTEHSDINLREYLPQEMAEPLTWIADVLGSNPLSMLTILLPVVASLTNPDTKLELIKSTQFYAKPILYTGIVAESGSAKSPTMKTIISPFKKLQNEADARYLEQLEEYQEDMRAWKATKKDDRGEEPSPPPPPREYFINDATAEAVSLIQSNQPNKGLLMEFDELGGLIKSANAYRGGKGTDAEKILSGRDGTGIKVNRASGKRLSNPRSTFSICGGIQRDVLKQQMGDRKDSQGHWARFLWAVMPIREAKFPDDEPPIYISSILEDLYRKIEALPAIDYKLSDKAREIYAQWFRKLESKKMDEANQALRAAYAKMKQFVGDLALLLQTIENAYYGEREAVISERIMNNARYLSAVYLRQLRLIYGEADTDNGNLSPIFKKIIELSNRKGKVTARDVSISIRETRKGSTAQIREMFNELKEMGYGEIIGNGRRLSFLSNGYTENVGQVLAKCWPNVGQVSTVPKTITNSEIQDIKNQSVGQNVGQNVGQTLNAETIAQTGIGEINSQNVGQKEEKTQPTEKTSPSNEKIESKNYRPTMANNDNTFSNNGSQSDLETANSLANNGQQWPTMANSFSEDSQESDLEAANSLANNGQQRVTLSNEWEIGDLIEGKVIGHMGMISVKGKIVDIDGERQLRDKNGIDYPLAVVEDIKPLSWEAYHHQ